MSAAGPSGGFLAPLKQDFSGPEKKCLLKYLRREDILVLSR